MDLELNHLTEEERDTILSVLRRDEDLRTKDLERIRQLKTDVKRIRLKGVIREGHEPDKTCARCREKFGWFFDKGTMCPQCQHKVCDKCKVPLKEGEDKWLCVLCFKQMELDAMSGQWFLMKFRKSKRNKKTNKVITGQEIVKTSIRHRPHSTGGSGSEAGRTTSDDVRKTLTNNNSSPKSSRSAGSGSVEESSDTQSTASTSPGRKKRGPDVHDIGFPKESDKQKLLDLIRSKAPVIGKEEIQKPTVEVRKVSLSRYRSDSESSSSSGPSSPQLSARTDSEFRYSDSIRSSIRSSGAFSAVSSEGRITIVTESCVSDMDSQSITSQMSFSDSQGSPAIPAGPYDKEAGHFQSTDSVIENKAHRPSSSVAALQPAQTKLTALCKDTTDGSVSISDNEISVRKVSTSKHADSMSSDSEAEEVTTTQVSKVKFRRIPMTQGQRRSRSPSPEPRSRSKANDVTANTLSSQVSSDSEERGRWVAAKGGSGDGDRQAGGDTNTPQHGPSRTPSTQHVLTLLSQPDPPHSRYGSAQQVNRTAASNYQQRVVGMPQSQQKEQDKGKVAANTTTPKTNTTAHKPNNIRDKVGALLAKYGRQESPGVLVEEVGTSGSGGGSPCSSRSSSSPSYEIIDVIDMAHNSSFDDLEWDADLVTSNSHHDTAAIRQGDDWDELRAAVAANMAAHINNPHNLSESDDEDEDLLVPAIAGISSRGNVRTRSQDDCSDTLSVITELTEPDEDIYQLEKDMFSSSHSVMTENSRTYPIDAFDCDKDYGYFTLPGNKGAISRTESMHSAPESEVSHNSITPSSDLDTDLSMSQLSDNSATSATESARDSGFKQHSIDKPDTLDDMLANVDEANDLPDLDEMYRVNLQVLNEVDLKGLTLPSLASLKPPRSDPLPRKFPALRNQDIRLSDRRTQKPEVPRTINSLTAVFETEKALKAKRDTWPQRNTDSAQLPDGNRRQMSKTQSDSKLRLMREQDTDTSVSPDLQRKRSQLRSVRSEKSLSYPLGHAANTQDEKPVDRSHLASISALTKMFDHPPSYLRPSVGYPVHRVEEEPSETETISSKALQVETKIKEDIGEINVESVTVHMSEKPASIVNDTFTMVVERNLEAGSNQGKSVKDKKQEEIKGKAVKEKKEKKDKREKKEKKSKSKSETHAISKNVIDKESKINNKMGLTDVHNKNNAAENSTNIQLSKSATKTKPLGHIAAEQISNTGAFSETQADITTYLPSLIREDSVKVTKRAPSPTVQAVQEKVGTTRSIPLREIICEELEREVLGNVSDVELHSSQNVFPRKEERKIEDLNVIRKESSQLRPSKEVSKKDSPKKPLVFSSPSEVEVEVEQQLDNWKRKREQKRRSTSPSRQEEAQSLYTQFQLGTSNRNVRTSTPPVTKDGEHAKDNFERSPIKAEFDSEDHQRHVEFSSPLPLDEAKLATERTQISISKQVETSLSLQVASAAAVYAGSEGEVDESDLSTEKTDTSYELEAAFLVPGVQTPADGNTSQTAKRGIRPQPPIPSDIDGDDNQAAESTESTLTPEPDWLGGSSDYPTVYTPTEVHRDADSDAVSDLYEEEEDDDEEDDLEEVSELSDLSEEQDASSASSVGRSSYDEDGSSYRGEGTLSVDTQETGSSLRSSRSGSSCSIYYSAYGGSQQTLLHNPCVSYDSLDVLVDEESDTADERANPAKVEEDIVLSLDLGPRFEHVQHLHERHTRPTNNPRARSNRNNNPVGDGSAWDGGSFGGGGGGRGINAGSRQHSVSPKSQHLPLSVSHSASHQPDGSRQPNGHGDATSVTSSMTESDAGSGSPRVTTRREHKTSITSVPSINITHHDSAPEAESSRDEEAVAAVAAAAAAVVADTQARAGDQSGQGSATEGDECEDIDELVASHTSPTHSIHSQKGGNLLSPFSGSRESIVSFYSDAGEGTYGNIPITGEIQFTLDYNYKTGSLELKVKQCRDLAPVDTKKKRSDPYVKVYLLPDKTKSGKRKTRVKKHTLNPVFDEVLKYAITKSELETRTLWLTVWHSDMFGRNDFLGEVTIPLDYYTFGEKEPQWYKLQERTRDRKKRAISKENLLDTKGSKGSKPTPPEDENASPLSLLTYKGDLILSLRYVTGDNAPSAGGKVRGGGNTSKRRPGSGELHVLLKEARNLTAVRANGFSDPFCKGYLLPDKGRGTKQKTPVAKRDCNPQWNHTFVFEDVSLEDLRDRSLELTVWDHDRFTSNDFLGGLRLNIGAGKVGGKEVDWMDSRGEEVSMWQAMLDRPNCWIDGSLMLRTTMERRK